MLDRRALIAMVVCNLVATLLALSIVSVPSCGKQRSPLAMPDELRATMRQDAGVIARGDTAKVETAAAGPAKQDAATAPVKAPGKAKDRATEKPTGAPAGTPTVDEKLVKPAADAAAGMRKTARAVLLPLVWVCGLSAVLGGVASIFVPVIPRRAVAAAGGAFAASLVLLYTIDRYGPLFAEIVIWAAVVLGVLVAVPWASALVKVSRARAREREALALIVKGHPDAGVAMLAAEVPSIKAQRKGLLQTVQAMTAAWQGTSPPLPDVAKRVMLAGLVSEAKRGDVLAQSPTVDDRAGWPGGPSQGASGGGGSGAVLVGS
jgi:hypothetical protein